MRAAIYEATGIVTDLEHLADAYAAMDARRTLGSLVELGTI
jgi:hypothetical protein